MRIGIALFQFFRGRIGGTAEYLERLIPGLLKVIAPDDQLLLCGNSENLAPFEQLDDSRVKRVEFPWSNRWIQALRFADLVLPVSPSARYAQRLNQLKLDVLFCPQQSIFPRGVKTKTVVTVMDLLHYRCPDQVSLWQRWLRRRKEQHLVEACDRTISISAATRTDLQLYYSIADEKCSVVHHGGRAFHAVTAAKSPVPDGAPYIFYPAAAFPHKNHSRLFDAFRRFRVAHPDIPARLVMSGQTSPQLQRLLEEQAIYGDVVHLGYISRAKVDAIYAGCQGVMLPTLFEGFGLPLIEGLGFGRPVCCSNLPVFEELVGDAVRYFNPYSVDEMTTAIADLFASRVPAPPATRVAAILGHLTWDRCAAETYAVLRAA
jgi:glycosyltransferase involved in cell wall biosynthesis